VKKDPYREKIRAAIDVPAQHLLWRHIGGRSKCDACLGKDGISRDTSDTEVHELRPTITQYNDIVRLYITVANPQSVGCLKGIQYLAYH